MTLGSWKRASAGVAPGKLYKLQQHVHVAQEAETVHCMHRVNMGTADEFSVDVLVNALLTVSRE